MFVQGSQTCAFAMIYTAIDTSPNVCIGKPYLLKVLCREPVCMVHQCRGASGYASYNRFPSNNRSLVDPVPNEGLLGELMNFL